MSDGIRDGYDPRSWWERWRENVDRWQRSVFGPAYTSASALKLAAEAKETAEAWPSPEARLKEIADCRICLMAVETASGFTEHEIRAAVARKMAINRARKWRRLDDGTWQHVKENEDK